MWNNDKTDRACFANLRNSCQVSSSQVLDPTRVNSRQLKKTQAYSSIPKAQVSLNSNQVNTKPTPLPVTDPCERAERDLKRGHVLRHSCLARLRQGPDQSAVAHVGTEDPPRQRSQASLAKRTAGGKGGGSGLGFSWGGGGHQGCGVRGGDLRVAVCCARRWGVC